MNVPVKGGWSGDISAPHSEKTHYYVDGVALCGKRKLKPYMNLHGSHSIGSIQAKQCSICIKKHKEILRDAGILGDDFKYINP